MLTVENLEHTDKHSTESDLKSTHLMIIVYTASDCGS